MGMIKPVMRSRGEQADYCHLPAGFTYGEGDPGYVIPGVLGTQDNVFAC